MTPIHISRSRVGQVIKCSIPFLILLSQNLAIFWRHYFGDVGFPWDFPMSYYALVAFWTCAVSRGIYPQWIPYQQMGYPFALQLQSGLSYPPFWIFPILHLPYTLNAAVITQCLHVLFGTVGMFLLLRGIVKDSRLALIGAFAFQCFGGFYSNAEHPDIIRAFALAPWLLHVFNLGLDEHRFLPRRVLFIPLFIFLLVTGAYPGNIISSLFIGAIYVLFQLIAGYFNGQKTTQLVRIAVSLFSLSLIGLAMTAIYLGPIRIYRNFLPRTENPQSMQHFFLWLEDLPGLFLSNRTLPGEISMTSAFVTLPILFFASFVPLSKLKQYWVYLGTGLISVLMVAGDKTPFWTVISNVFSFLKLSRMTSSDYRIFIAIPVIILAILGLDAILFKKTSIQQIIYRVVFIAGWFFPALYAVYHTPSTEFISTILVASAALGLVLILWQSHPGPSTAAIASILLLISLDAIRVLPDMPTWQEQRISAFYSDRKLPYEQDGQLVVCSIFDHVPGQRPSRIASGGVFPWVGYMDGRYMMDDLPPSLLKTYFMAKPNPIYQDYMLREWSPLLLFPESTTEGKTSVNLSDDDLVSLLKHDRSDDYGSVKQLSYGTNEISYQVSLQQERIVIENEIYFPGWSARLILANGQREIESFPANGVFRAWDLPPGDYQMVARFQFPDIELFGLASLLGLGTWIMSIIVAYGYPPGVHRICRLLAEKLHGWSGNR